MVQRGEAKFPRRGLAYGISGSLIWLDHTALMLGSTATRADATGQTIEIIEQEIRRLADEGPTEVAPGHHWYPQASDLIRVEAPGDPHMRKLECRPRRPLCVQNQNERTPFEAGSRELNLGAARLG